MNKRKKLKMVNQQIVFIFLMSILGVNCQTRYFNQRNAVEVKMYICNHTTTDSYYIMKTSYQSLYINYVNGSIPINTLTLSFSLSRSRNVTISDNKVVDDTYRDNTITDDVIKSQNIITFQRNAAERGVLPYFGTIFINSEEFCRTKENVCGKRKVTHKELIVSGDETKPGDWPWHAAIYRLEKFSTTYICGGTLISRTFVLTAAHCTTINGVPVLPDILNVALGKYNLNGGNFASQEREVHQVIVHDEFNKKKLKNDIALLKLKSIAEFDDYVQPACIWNTETNNKLPTENVIGTVVGWGLDQNSILSPKLRKASFTILQDITCIRQNPLFYSTVLDGRRFCAGGRNGTSPCNGDSGGGFLVFVPDISNDPSPNAPGAWYIRGVVSLTVALAETATCDPYQNAVFTDVAEYENYINENIKYYLK